MSTYLINHALAHVWCAPRMDLQSQLKPARICPKDGLWNKAKVMWSTFRLPTQKERYYVYQIGQLDPAFMGLLDKKRETWVSFADACMATNLMVDIYSIEGIQLPRMLSYYMVTNDNNIVIAVKDQRAKIAFDLRSADLYIRFYSNAYYSAQRDNPDQTVITVSGGIPRNNADIVALQMQYEALLKQPGAAWAYINGFKADSISLLTVKVDDIVEMVHDASVIRTVTFTVGDLRTFDSTLDKKRKYLLHYPGTASTDIDYHDDIDFYLVMPDGDKHRGIYMHRNATDLVRMVTHRDYAMSVQGLLAFAQYRANWVDVNKLQVIAIIRKGGWNRTIVPENNRINELYALQDNDVRDAMLGVNSVVQNWRADTLEASAYAAIMRAESMLLDQAIVEDAYGYNAISVLLGMTPSKVRINSLQKEVDVPYGLMKNSTAYEYDASGALLGWYPHLNAGSYVCRNIEADMVEQLVGLADSRIDEVYAQQTQVLDPNFEYRMYVCDIVDGNATDVWRDVTANGGMYAIDSNNVLRWAIDPAKVCTMVRSNSMILAYSFNQKLVNGTLDFTLSQRVLRNNLIAIQKMQLPMGVLEIFMNRRKLINGLDYYVEFPKVFVVNKEYLVNPDYAAQNIAIRFTGHCDFNFNMEPPTDFGFVQHGVLSNNSRYDLRNDRVQHISVGGYLYDKSELKFAEGGLTVSPVDAKNGQPYVVQDIFVPFKGVTTQKTLKMREASRAIDKVIADYMTLKIPEQVVSTPSAITAKYSVYSPFISRIISDLNNGYLNDDRLKQHYSTDLVKQLCAPYLWLLAYEPTSETLEADPRYVDVAPHPWPYVVDVNIYSYKFVKMVVDYYLAGKINLSTNLRISSM